MHSLDGKADPLRGMYASPGRMQDLHALAWGPYTHGPIECMRPPPRQVRAKWDVISIRIASKESVLADCMKLPTRLSVKLRSRKLE